MAVGCPACALSRLLCGTTTVQTRFFLLVFIECLAVADSLCVPSDLIISFKSLYEKLRKVGLSAPPLHQPGNTFLLNSGDEANLKDFMESDYRNTLPASNVTCVAENSGVSYAAAATPRVASEDSSLDRPATYRNEYYLTNFERANFNPENVTPEQPCTAYFNSDIFADSNAAHSRLKGFQLKQFTACKENLLAIC